MIAYVHNILKPQPVWNPNVPIMGVNSKIFVPRIIQIVKAVLIALVIFLSIGASRVVRREVWKTN